MHATHFDLVIIGTGAGGGTIAQALAASGAFDGVSVVIRKSVLRMLSPDHMRGRISAVGSIFITSSNELGAFESGVAGQILGPSAAVVLGGAATLAVALSWARAFPALRSVDRFPTPVDDGTETG